MPEHTWFLCRSTNPDSDASSVSLEVIDRPWRALRMLVEKIIVPEEIRAFEVQILYVFYPEHARIIEAIQLMSRQSFNNEPFATLKSMLVLPIMSSIKSLAQLNKEFREHQKQKFGRVSRDPNTRKEVA